VQPGFVAADVVEALGPDVGVPHFGVAPGGADRAEADGQPGQEVIAGHLAGHLGGGVHGQAEGAVQPRRGGRPSQAVA